MPVGHAEEIMGLRCCERLVAIGNLVRLLVRRRGYGRWRIDDVSPVGRFTKVSGYGIETKAAQHEEHQHAAHANTVAAFE